MVKFKWHVDVDGYAWTKVKDEYYLEPLAWRFREYAPIDEFSGLFRSFADLEPTREEILKFADRYGNLGAEFDVHGVADEPPAPPDEVETRAQQRAWLREEVATDYRLIDSLWQWQISISEMRECVDTWEMLQAGDVSEQSIREIRSSINNGLDKDQFRMSLEENEARGGLALRCVPKSLLGGLWVQFALAVSENKQYRRCRTCGLWFELSPQVNRVSRFYCSEACRSRAYRARKDRARQLSMEGKSLREIAHELNSDVNTIKRWLEHRKEEPHGS